MNSPVVGAQAHRTRLHRFACTLLTPLLALSLSANGALEEDPTLAARVASLRAQAEDARQAGNLDEAIDKLKLAIEIGVNKELAMRIELRELRKLRAEQIVAQGEGLLEEKRYEEAAERFIDSMGYSGSGEARSGLRQARKPFLKDARKRAAKARSDYRNGAYAQALARLEGIGDGGVPSVIHLDRALASHGLGESRAAALHMDRYIATLPDGKQKNDALMVQAVMETRAGQLDPEGFDLPVYRRTNRVLRSLMDQQAFSSGNDSTITPEDPGGLCELLEEVRGRVGDHPVLIYDLALCYEAMYRLDDARSLLERYLELVDNAGDQEIVAEQLAAFDKLEALPDDRRAAVARHMTDARLLSMRARYRDAITELEQANTLAPDYSPPLWQLALIHEALGEVPEARAHLERYARLSDASPQRVEAGRASLDLAQEKRQRYDELVVQGRRHTTDVLARVFESLVVGTPLNDEYIQRELSLAATPLSQALELYPLAYEGNLYMAFVLQQLRQYEPARRAMEAVFAHDRQPVYFAFLSIKRTRFTPASDAAVVAEEERRQEREPSVLVDGKGRALVRVSFRGDDVSLRSLATYSKAQRDWQTLWKETPQADAFWDEKSSLPQEIFRASDAQVRTDGPFVRLELNGADYLLSPFFLLGETPLAGADARSFGNRYARLFERFGGFEETELGKEGITALEVLATASQLGAGAYLIARGYVVLSAYSNPNTVPIALLDDTDADTRFLGRFRQEQLLAIDPPTYKLLPIDAALPDWVLP